MRAKNVHKCPSKKKKYIKGIKSPLTRKKRIEIASLKLSEKYPLLTVENVQYWY